MQNQNNLAAVAEAWRRGILHWKFREVQKLIYQTWLESKKRTKKLVCIASRRLGKSTMAFAICLEEAIKHPGSNILFITPVNKNVDRYVMDIASQLLGDCPDEVRPEWLPQKAIYLFPNGSKIFCVGSSNQSYENLRGARVNLAVIDEAQRMDELEIIVDEVIIPSLLDSDGFLLMFGTVPRQPGNPFMRRYVKDAERENAYAEFDIYAAGYPPERIAFFRSQVSQEAWEREFECKRNADKKLNVVPNWKDEYVQFIERPKYFDSLVSYTALDIGGALDQTHMLYAYYDSEIDKLIIDAESVWEAQESRTHLIADAAKRKEKEMSRKVLRVSDTNNFILMKELQEKYRLFFFPVKKGPGSLEAHLEKLNKWVEDGRIIINPRCSVLLAEMKLGSWNKTRTDLARSEGNHCDGLIALAYMLTIVNDKKKIAQTVEESKEFIPPPKDPLNINTKKGTRVAPRDSDEAFEYKDVSSSIWKKEI